MSWTPIWDHIVDSTLWEEPAELRVVFVTMLALKQRDHTVRMPLRRLAKRANLPFEVVEGAVRTLEQPDRRSAEDQPYDGRRIERLEGEEGWLILNGEKYQRQIRLGTERARKAAWAREHRSLFRKARRASSLPQEREVEQEVSRPAGGGVNDDLGPAT